MNDIELDDHEGTLERAMIAAISLIADMDESLPEGSVTVVPEEILQTLEKSAPSLMSEVTRSGFREQLLSHLGDYGILRQHVPDWLDLEGFLDWRQRVFFHDLLEVLEAENWRISRRAFHTLFLSIAPVIQARLEAAYAIEW
ncbi:hypothetical protein PQR71_18030 [Paraburkholderia fungorum]|uniref:hypothetical protein n=1 Tax=Paraburkholderia fungorum TaxID=134537 RepID=UPI0038BB0FCA